MIELRPHQRKAADAIEDAYNSGIKRPLVNMCVGSGKSLTMAELGKRFWSRGRRSIINAHTRELVRQNAKASRLLGVPTGINAAALGERTWRAPVISASINSVFRNAGMFDPATAQIMTDECFPAGTLVSTPDGDRRIESLSQGDEVFHALGVGRVEMTSVRLTNRLVEVEFDDGTTIRCTKLHPLFTLQGWTQAGRLEPGACVVSEKGMLELRRSVHPNSAERARSQRASLGEAAFLLNILLEESRERHERPGRNRTNEANTSQDRASADNPWWERSGHDRGASGVDLGSRGGLGGGTCDPDAKGKVERVPVELQSRYCAPIFARSDRGRWCVPQRTENDIRCEERRSVAVARVVRVSNIELASDCSVYNLHVSGHPSYFADGLLVHNCHLIPHVESGMYREFHRGFPDAFFPGFSGTTFRMLGGSLTEGEGAPFDACVYDYTILDGIADGYLVPAFSAPADDVIDTSTLRTLNGEFTGASQDAHNIAQMDNHIAQMVHHGSDRRAWLVFEASQKSALAMTERLRQWGITAALVIDKTDPDERERIITDFLAGKIRCLVNVAALTTGFDAQIVDMVVLRRATKSLGLYIQMIGRLLRTIGGNIESSIAAGKADGLLIDFGRNVETHGPLDFIEPVHKAMKMVSCEHCAARNSPAAARCYACDEPMTKLCPACVKQIQKGLLDCPHCDYDMRTGGTGEERKTNLTETSTAAELIASFAKVNPKAGGWIPIRKVWKGEGLTFLDANGDRWNVPAALEAHASTARWLRGEAGEINAILKRNGNSQNSALQVTVEGAVLPVPMPSAA